MPPIGIIKNSICIAVTMFQWIFIIQIIAVPVIVIVKTYTTNMFSISLIRPVNILCNSFKQIIDKTSNISINPTIILLNVYFVIFLLITFFSILFYLKHNSDKQNQPKTKKFPLKDAPLEKDDNYEPKGTLESLKQFIFDMSGESNQCLLLDGPWGSGKTSLIYQLHTKETPQHSNESTNENYIIYLNSWHLSNIHELITEIRNEIYRLCSRAFIAVPHNLIRYINIICDGAGGIRQTIANAIRENDTAKNIKQEREELDLLISRTNEILGYNNIIIVFDELERIYDENKIHNIVGFIHYLRDLHIPIIVSCNFNEIKYKFIKNVPDTGFKSDQNPFTPSPHFWEKIFTIQFPMISPMPAEKASHLINKYFDHEMKEYLDGALQNKWHTDELNEIFATVHTILRQDSVYRFFRNYRQIKLFVNKFIERGISLKQALSKETKISDQIDIDALFWLCCLEISFPNTINQVKQKVFSTNGVKYNSTIKSYIFDKFYSKESPKHGKDRFIKNSELEEWQLFKRLGVFFKEDPFEKAIPKGKKSEEKDIKPLVLFKNKRLTINTHEVITFYFKAHFPEYQFTSSEVRSFVNTKLKEKRYIFSEIKLSPDDTFFCPHILNFISLCLSFLSNKNDMSIFLPQFVKYFSTEHNQKSIALHFRELSEINESEKYKELLYEFYTKAINITISTPEFSDDFSPGFNSNAGNVNFLIEHFLEVVENDDLFDLFFYYFLDLRKQGFHRNKSLSLEIFNQIIKKAKTTSSKSRIRLLWFVSFSGIYLESPEEEKELLQQASEMIEHLLGYISQDFENKKFDITRLNELKRIFPFDEEIKNREGISFLSRYENIFFQEKAASSISVFKETIDIIDNVEISKRYYENIFFLILKKQSKIPTDFQLLNKKAFSIYKNLLLSSKDAVMKLDVTFLTENFTKCIEKLDSLLKS